MGFITPTLPDMDLDEWRSRPHLGRLQPLAQDWAENGFGTPYAIYLLYVVKVAAYALGGIAVVSATTHGVGSLSHFDSWWTEPVVYQKFVVWTLVYEILGLGCGSLPLTFRFLPPVGGFLYWLRPGTVRLPPWPSKIPLTRGTTRTVVDVALYVAVVGTGIWLLLSSAALEPARIAPLLIALGLLGLRDKTTFLAARPEHYALMLVIFLFPIGNMIIALKLVMVAMWWGAASSKLNRHFPYVVAVMVSNTPWQRSKWLKRRLWRDFPTDIRPSRLTELAAHGGTVIEYTVPLILLLSRGGTLTVVAVTIMVLFHIHITSTFPLGVPLEWNIFFIFSTLFLFGHYSHVGFSTLDAPLLAVVLAACLVGLPVLGNARPELISFLASMRYYAGNWATSQWAFRKGTEPKLMEHLVTAAPTVMAQLTRLYDAETAELLLYKGLAFRALHTHGRALNGLLPRALDDIEAYDLREGELVAGMVLGWNFGEGHLHNQQLLDAVQERCHFAPGELRVIMLESQPMQRARQHYRIVDAASGLIEEGYVEVKDMVSRQPWLDLADGTVPVEVITSRAHT